MSQVGETVRALALVDAQSSLEKDILYRRWVALHGGVYVPITDESPPNPHLADIAERDIATPSGRHLTLVNPAYMTRQVGELARKTNQHRGHLTSLKPIRPENIPDEWERRALQAFERGVPEVSSIEFFDGEDQLRLMRPLKTEASCLKCHEAQGYKVGDIRGGLSEAVPMKEYEANLQLHHRAELLAHGGIWGVGLVSIGVGVWQVRRRQRERDLAEVALRESETRYRLIFASSPLPMWVYDPNTLRFLEVNEAAVCHYGYTQDELRTMTLRDIRPPEDVPALEALQPRIQQDQITKGEWRHRKKDGTVIQVSIHSQSIQLAGRNARLVLAEDITERKRLERVVASHAAQLQTVIETEPECVKIISPEGRLLHMNSAGLQMIEVGSLAEAQSRSLQAFVAPEHQPAFLALHRQVMQGESAMLEFEVIGLKGTRRWLETHAVPLRDPDSGRTNLLGVTRDITERKKAEEELHRHNERLERFNRFTVGRELRMIELKQEINELCEASGQPARYAAKSARELTETTARKPAAVPPSPPP